MVVLLPTRKRAVNGACIVGVGRKAIFKHHVRLKLLETEDWDEWQQNMLHFSRKPYVQG